MREREARVSGGLVKKPPAVGRSGFDPGSGRSPGDENRLPTPVFLGFPGGSDGKESTYNAGDLGLIAGLGRSPEEGKGYPLHIQAWRIPWTAHFMRRQRA